MTTYYPSSFRFVRESPFEQPLNTRPTSLSGHQTHQMGLFTLSARCYRWKNSNHQCSGRVSNPGRLRGSLTLYHVTIKAGLYRKAVQVYQIPITTILSYTVCLRQYKDQIWFSCINIRQVPKEGLKTETGGCGFQHLPRDLANVKALKIHVRSLLLHKIWKRLLHFALFLVLFCFAFSPMSRERYFHGLCSF